MLDFVRHFVREFETDDSETGDTITVMVQDRSANLYKKYFCIIVKPYVEERNLQI
jgi:hypothetical protein